MPSSIQNCGLLTVLFDANHSPKDGYNPLLKNRLYNLADDFLLITFTNIWGIN